MEFCVRKRQAVEFEWTLLAGDKDQLLNQARSDLAKRELHVESLNKCIGDLQKRTEAQNRALQDVHNEFVESRREQTRLQEELLRNEKLFEMCRFEICTKWDKFRELKKYEKMRSQCKS